jgi:protoporphyrinogen oxidase
VNTASSPVRIGIIGGGPGGLMTAYALQKEATFPCEVTIFEASSRTGGKIITRQFQTEPVPYEAGAAELYDYSALGEDPLKELIAEMGLSTAPMGGEVVVMDNKILETYGDIRRAFGDKTVRELKKFWRKAENAISPAEYYESDWKEDNASSLSQHSFQALLNSIPDEQARKYVKVCVHSDLATEPHQTSAMYGLQNYLMNEPEYMTLYTIVGGIERLVQELAKRLTARVLLNRPVTKVEKAGNGYWVHSRERDEARCDEFDYLVVALPNNWIPAIDWAGETLSRAMHRHHAYYDKPAHYLRVSVLFEKPFWRHRITDSYFMIDAFGGCCVYDESSRSEAGTRGVLGWLLAGEAAQTMANLDDESLTAAVLDSLPPVFGNPRPYFMEARIHRWLGSVNGLPGGRVAKEPLSRHRPEPVEHGGLLVVGDYLFDSTLNGVLDSSEMAVDFIVDDVVRGFAAPGYAPANGGAANASLGMATAAACATAPPTS